MSDIQVKTPGSRTGVRSTSEKAEAARKRLKAYRQSNSARYEMADVLRIFKRKKTDLGITPCLYETMDHLFSYTTKADWDAAMAIIWPSNRRLAEELNISIRSVQLRLKTLTEMGLICHRDSPNGGRWGHRDNEGRIIEAFGIDLTALATLMPEWKADIDKMDIENVEKSILRRKSSQQIKRIRTYIDTVLNTYPRPDREREKDLEELFQTCAKLSQESHKPHISLATVRDNFETIKTAADDLCEWIDTSDHQTGFTEPTCETEDDIESLDTPNEDNRNDEAKAQSENASVQALIPVVHPEADDSPDSNLPFLPDRLPPFSRDVVMYEHLKLYGITPRFVSDVCSAFNLHLEGKSPSWQLLVETSDIEAKRLGIAKHAIQRAAKQFGVYGAALAVYVISERSRLGLLGIMDEVRSEGALYSKLSDLAQSGVYDLGQKLHGYKKRLPPSPPSISDEYFF